MNPVRALTVTEVMVVLPIAVVLGAGVALGPPQWVMMAAAGATLTVGAALGIAKALDQPQLVVVWCVGAAVFFMPLNALRATPSATYSDLLLVVAVPLAGLVVLWRPERLRMPGWLLAAAALILASILLVELFPVPILPSSDVFSNRNLATGEVSTGSSFVLGARLLFALVVVPGVIALVADTSAQIRWFANAWIAGVAVSSGVAALAAFGGPDLQEVLTGGEYFIAEFRGQPGRYAGLTVHPGALGLTIAMVCPLIFARMTTLRRAAAYAPLIALLVAAVLVSGSRIGIIAISVGALLVVAWHQRSRRQVVIIATGAALVVAIVGGTLSTLERFTDQSTTAAASNAARLGSYRDGWDLFVQRPLTGYGYSALRGAHNLFLQLLDSGGVFALAGYSLVFGGLLSSGWKLRNRLPADMAGEALGLVVALVVFLASSMVGSAIFDRYIYIPAGLLLAFLLVERSGRLKGRAQLPNSHLSGDLSGRRWAPTDPIQRSITSSGLQE